MISYAFLRGVRAALYRHYAPSGAMSWFVRFERPSVCGSASAIVATDELGRLVGMLVYQRRGSVFRSRLTYVAARARGLGVGAALWRLALAELRPRAVCVFVVSDRGLRLVRAVEAQHPRVTFRVYEQGKRKLRAA